MTLVPADSITTQEFQAKLCCSVTKSHLTLCDPMDYSTPGFPVHHYLPEFAQTHVHQVRDATQPSRPLLSTSTPFIFPSIRVFPNESALLIRWPKYCCCSFSVSPSNKYSELISFRNDWFDFLAAQETLKSLFQHHSFKTSTLQCSTFFMVQLNWKDRFSHMVHPYVTTGKTIASTIWTFVSKVMSLLFHILSRAEHLEYPGLIFPCHNFKASAQYGKPNWG